MQVESLRASGSVGGSIVVAALAGIVAWSMSGGYDANAWSGPLAVASGVLAVAGAGKVADPRPAALALREVGVPVAPSLVVLLGLVEVAVGAAAAVVGGALLAATVGAFYVGFAVVAVRMSTNEAVRSCGCFGRGGARPGLIHLAVNVVASGGAFAAALTGAGGAVAAISDTPGAGVPALFGLVLAVAATVALLTTAAEVLDLAGDDAAPTPSTSFHLVENAS